MTWLRSPTFPRRLGSWLPGLMRLPACLPLCNAKADCRNLHLRVCLPFLEMSSSLQLTYLLTGVCYRYRRRDRLKGEGSPFPPCTSHASLGALKHDARAASRNRSLENGPAPSFPGSLSLLFQKRSGHVTLLVVVWSLCLLFVVPAIELSSKARPLISSDDINHPLRARQATGGYSGFQGAETELFWPLLLFKLVIQTKAIGASCCSVGNC